MYLLIYRTLKIGKERAQVTPKFQERKEIMKGKERTEVKLTSQERKATTKGKEKVDMTMIPSEKPSDHEEFVHLDQRIETRSLYTK